MRRFQAEDKFKIIMELPVDSGWDYGVANVGLQQVGDVRWRKGGHCLSGGVRPRRPGGGLREMKREKSAREAGLES